MKEFFSSKNLKMVLGFATGFIIYDYFVHGEIDWIRAIVTAIFASIITVLFFIIRIPRWLASGVACGYSYICGYERAYPQEP